MEILNNAARRSTYLTEITLVDEEGTTVSANSVTWTLTDAAGNVVNGRENVVASPAVPIAILLAGDDLDYTGDGDDGLRVLTLTALYDSSLGTNIPIVKRFSFALIE